MIERHVPIDRSFLYTKDKIFFSVCGNAHSPNAFFGMPYYFPTKTLEEIMDIQIDKFLMMNGEKYTKLLNLISRESYPDFIQHNFPDYYYSPTMWRILMKVDRNNVQNVISPLAHARKILSHMDRDDYSEENPLMYVLHKMVQFDKDFVESVGIGGSGMLRDDYLSVGNDIDFVIYDGCVRLAREFSWTMVKNNSRFRGLEGGELDTYVKQKLGIKDVTEPVKELVNRRWDVLYVDGVKLDFSFADPNWPTLATYETDQIPEQVTTTATIVDSNLSYYFPTVLGIDSQVAQYVITTKRGYICLFEKGQEVKITGFKYTINDGTPIILIDEFSGGNIIPI